MNGAEAPLPSTPGLPPCELSPAAGRIYLACDYSYQGNSGGGWKAVVTSRETLLKDGWTLVPSDLRMWERKEDMTVFTKVLPAGTTLRLCCNKYWPPMAITF